MNKIPSTFINTTWNSEMTMMTDVGICSAAVLVLTSSSERVKDEVMCTAGRWMRYHILEPQQAHSMT